MCMNPCTYRNISLCKSDSETVFDNRITVLDFFRDNSGKSAEEFTHAYLSNTKFFGGEDLTKVAGLEETITEYIKDIRERGMRAVVNDLALD